MSIFETLDNLILIAAGSGTDSHGLEAQFLPAPEIPVFGKPGKHVGDIFVQSKSGLDQIIIVSLGESKRITPEIFRQAGGKLAQWLIQNRVAVINIHLEPPTFIGDEIASIALCEGLKLGAFQFTRHKSKIDYAGNVQVYIFQSGSNQLLDEKLKKISTITTKVNLARDLGNEPANRINPETLSQHIKELSDGKGLRFREIEAAELASLGAGAIVAVGKGSKTPSRLIILEYPGHNPIENAKPVILVGKAITFDTGGYSLKSVENIVNMKTDKCGGVTAVSAVLAAAELQLQTPVIAIIGAAENMISGESYRPDDILTTMSGKTVEVISTDAEGRLVLADALTYAQNNYQPRAIIDLATLTGGVVVALGKVRAGIMSNNDLLAQQLFDAGERTFERLWRLPLDDEYFPQIKSEDADIKNSGGREAQPVIGGIFLKQFVDDSIPWAHIDIAGMADTPKDLPYSPKGVTGFGVRLLVDYLSRL
jgi:leucyl aminopeptidase